MLAIIVTLFSNYIIYICNNYKTTCSRIFKYLYFIISIITSLSLLVIFLEISNYTHLTALLWSIYIPFSINLSYLFFETICIQKPVIYCIILWMKSFVCIMLFVICFRAYSKNYICALPQGTPLGHLTFSTVMLAILIGSFLWLYGEGLFRYFKKFAYQIYVALLIITPFFMFFILEISGNSNIRNISLFNVWLNVLIMMVFEIVILNLLKNKAYGLYILYFSVLIIGVANHFVIIFRNNPIMPIDIFAIRTALSVSSQYQYYLTDGVTTALIITLLLIGLISVFNRLAITNKEIHVNKVIVQRSISIMTLMISVFWIGTTNFEKSYAITIDWWRPGITYQNNGFMLAFITMFQKLKIEKPEAYSTQLASEILEDTAKERKSEAVSAVQKPTIIVIMNESFSDLSVLGPFECTREHLNNFYSLKNDPGIIEHGYNYVSIRGGGTANSEFEFLTGNSMSNLPGGYPYTMYNFDHISSMVQMVKNQGYKAIAMHPEDPGNWKRNSVYTAMGFEEFLSYKNFRGYETTISDRISDLGNYKKLINIYEKQKQPAFIFNITMQNHGGYDINIIKEEKKSSIDDEYIQYSDVQAYQSLINDSDEALGYLMDYFRGVDEPVIICFFGDHQPSLNNEFENKLAESGIKQNDSDLFNQERYFAVPYFIWSNYKVNESITKNNSDGINITSANYLGVQVQYYAGLELSKYGTFLLNQREQIPVLNSIGYLGADGLWYSLTDDSQFVRSLKNYQVVQFYGLFDKKKNIDLFNIREMP